MADFPSGSCGSFDPGSTRIKLGVYDEHEGPKDVLMGRERDLSGQFANRFYYPAEFTLPEKAPDEVPDKIPPEGTGIELAGFRPDIGKQMLFGLKQGMDDDLCKPGSQGALIRTHLARYGPLVDVVDDCLTKIFRFGKERMDLHRKEKGYVGPLRKLYILIPAKYTRGPKGREAQAQYTRCAISAGFPADAIDFRSEAGASVWYAWHLENPDIDPFRHKAPELIRTLMMINMGGAVMDISTAELQGWTIRLLSKSVSSGGGILNVLGPLDNELRDKPHAFNYLKQHLFNMDEDCKSYRVDSEKEYQGEDLAKRMYDCYDEGLTVAEGLLWRFPDLTDVMLTGVPPSTNKLIKSQTQQRFDRLRGEMRKKGHAAEFLVKFLDPDFASNSAHRGGCIPYEDNPALRFHNLCFGILIRGIKPEKKRKRKRDKSPEPQEDILCLVQIKEAYSDDLEEYWEPVHVTKPNKLTIEPHTISYPNWKPLKEGLKSLETGRPVGLAEGAMPMERITVVLKERAKPERPVWVRFRRKDPESQPTQYTLQVDCRNRTWKTGDPKTCIEIDLELCCDEERCFFVRRDAPQDNDDRDDEDDEDEDDVREDREAPNQQVPGDQQEISETPKRKSARLSERQGGAEEKLRERASRQRHDIYDGPYSEDGDQIEASKQLTGLAGNTDVDLGSSSDKASPSAAHESLSSNPQAVSHSQLTTATAEDTTNNNTHETVVQSAGEGSDPQQNLSHASPTGVASNPVQLPGFQAVFGHVAAAR